MAHIESRLFGLVCKEFASSLKTMKVHVIKYTKLYNENLFCLLWYSARNVGIYFFWVSGDVVGNVCVRLHRDINEWIVYSPRT